MYNEMSRDQIDAVRKAADRLPCVAYNCISVDGSLPQDFTREYFKGELVQVRRPDVVMLECIRDAFGSAIQYAVDGTTNEITMVRDIHRRLLGMDDPRGGMFRRDIDSPVFEFELKGLFGSPGMSLEDVSSFFLSTEPFMGGVEVNRQMSLIVIEYIRLRRNISMLRQRCL